MIPDEHIQHFMSQSREDQALELARQVVEQTLIDLRTSRISHLTGGNGFVIREVDGSESSMMRLRTKDGLRIGIEQHTKVLAMTDDEVRAELLRLDARYDELDREREAQDADGDLSATFIAGG